MSIAIWPPGLPAAAVFPADEEWQPNYVETEMDDKMFKPKRRPRTTGETSKIPIQVTGMTVEQRALLRAFYYSTLHGGCDPFTWKNPQTGEDATFVFDGPVSVRQLTLSPKTYLAAFNVRIDP